MHRKPDTTQRRRQSRAGFSLVEVLVAIALLVVGIVAIISLFPPGFQAMENAQNRTAVRQAGSNELARAQANLGQIALIYSEYNATTDDLTWNVNVSSASDYANGGINSERIVSGELFPIPAQNTASPSISTYMTTFGPIVVPAGSDPGSEVSVRGTPWAQKYGTAYLYPAVTTNPNDDPNYGLTHDQPQYLIDYANGQLALPLQNAFVKYNQAVADGGPLGMPASYTEVVNFSVWAPEPGATVPTYHLYSRQFTYDPTVTGFVVRSPNPGSGGDGLYHSLWFDPTQSLVTGTPWTYTDATTGVKTPSTPGTPWEPGTATLSRDYTYVSSSTAFTGDPFLYTIDTNPSGLGGSVNAGAIHFPVEASDMRGADGKAVNALVDYKVADWHILREDVVANSDNLRLTVPAVLGAGDQMELGLVYTGLLSGTGLASGSTADLFIYDVDQGLKLSTADYSLSYNTGRLTLTGAYANSNARLRIYYRARHQWGMAATKAASSYTYGGTLPTTAAKVALGTYYTDSSLTKLYFPFTDNGKTVSLSQVKVIDGTSKVIVQHGGAWAILPTTVSSIQFGYIDLTQSRPSDGNPPGVIPASYTLDTSNGAPLSSVVGASSMLRAVYYEQNAIRHEDITSYSSP